jgi:glycerol-3-phosphate dehydrogenase
LIHLAQTAVDHGAALLNYFPVTQLSKDEAGYINGVIAEDKESGEKFAIQAKVVVNAAGIFADSVRQLADPAAQKMIAPSQGIHLVFDGSFLSADTAIMVPHTSDGRVLFAIPWHGHTLVGTTDTEIDGPSYDPLPFEEEIEFVLDTAGQYLSHPPSRADILSVYVGIRPLVKAAGASVGSTSALSRDHTIQVDQSGLLTIVGGKWTTYRHMAEDCVNHAITLGKLPDTDCVTKNLKIHGYLEGVDDLNAFAVYGSDIDAIRAIAAGNPELGRPLHPDLPYIGAEVVWGVREEMARTLDDVLSRRLRALFLNARASIEMAPAVARIMAAELGDGEDWIARETAAFQEFAKKYQVA